MQPLILSRFPLHKPAPHSYWCSEASLHVTPSRENGLSSPASWTWWTSQRGKSWRTLEDDWKADGWGARTDSARASTILHRPPILIINHRPRCLIGPKENVYLGQSFRWAGREVKVQAFLEIYVL